MGANNLLAPKAAVRVVENLAFPNVGNTVTLFRQSIITSGHSEIVMNLGRSPATLRGLSDLQAHRRQICPLATRAR